MYTQKKCLYRSPHAAPNDSRDQNRLLDIFPFQENWGILVWFFIFPLCESSEEVHSLQSEHITKH